MASAASQPITSGRKCHARNEHKVDLSVPNATRRIRRGFAQTPARIEQLLGGIRSIENEALFGDSLTFDARETEHSAGTFLPKWTEIRFVRGRRVKGDRTRMMPHGQFCEPCTKTGAAFGGDLDRRGRQ